MLFKILPSVFLALLCQAVRLKHDQLLVLHQVRDELKATAGDKGIIEEISSNPVKLIFATEDAKKIILDAPHPFQKIFIVDIEVKRSAGKVVLYRVPVVKDSLEKSGGDSPWFHLRANSYPIKLAPYLVGQFCEFPHFINCPILIDAQHGIALVAPRRRLSIIRQIIMSGDCPFMRPACI
jgi:hypothetical protein